MIIRPSARKLPLLGVSALTALGIFAGCGSDDPAAVPGGNAAGNAGRAGSTAAGGNNAGSAGSRTAVAGSAGAAGTTAAGAGGTASGGTAGSAGGGAGGNVSAGAGGTSNAGAAGTSNAGAAGTSGGPSALVIDCPTPSQDTVDTSAWPEIFVGTAAQGCVADSVAGVGSLAKPFCNPHAALLTIKKGGTIVTFLDGVYRLVDLPKPDGGVGALGFPSFEYTAGSFVVLRAAKGAKPVILGSERFDPKRQAWSKWVGPSGAPRIYRLPVDALREDPKAFYEILPKMDVAFASARRFRHAMLMREGVRTHADVASLSEGGPGSLETSTTELSPKRDFSWTKASAAGLGCGASNAGCYVYLRIDDAAYDPALRTYELSQVPAINTAPGRASYAVFDGLHTRFTQCGGLNCSVSIEGSDEVVIRNGSFGHVANSDDNSYALGLWRTNGSKVYDNEVFDSAYWGGVSNSKGITFMVSGAKAPSWVCRNDVHDIPGHAGIGTKNGVRDLRVVGNYVHDSTTCVATNKGREQDGVFYAGGDWTVQQNVFARCDVGVALDGELTKQPPPDEVVNNVFVDNAVGVGFNTTSPPGSAVHNNLFLGGPRSNACDGQHCGAAIYYANNAGEVRDIAYVFETVKAKSSHNAFFGFTQAYGVTRNWTANYASYTVAQIQTMFGAEKGSLVSDPLVDADYRPKAGSPLIGAGDGSVVGLPTVNIGRFLK